MRRNGTWMAQRDPNIIDMTPGKRIIFFHDDKLKG